ncbi:pilus assembly protein PilM [Pandoraea sp.]|uniref:type IV pilus biogenesis protein PilM n=1 Tax=Pandoraea sp. TaxID=1883445 RepID=UPI0025DB7188|nr:pilus assembly protein PilM [Pandoraea sp.]
MSFASLFIPAIHRSAQPRELLGIDIGDVMVRLVALARNGGEFSLQHIGEITLPAGAMAGGRAVQFDAVVAALQQWAGPRTWPPVVLAMPEHQLVRQRMSSIWHLAEPAIEASAARLLGGDAMSVRYDVVSSSVRPHGKRDRRLLIAALDDCVDERAAVAEAACLKPHAIDAERLAVQRAFGHAQSATGEPAGTSGGLLVVDGSGAYLSVFSGPQLVAERILPYEDVVANSVDGDDTTRWLAAGESVTQVLTRLPATVSTLWLAGEGSGQVGLDQAIEQVTRLPTKSFDPFAMLPRAGGVALPPVTQRSAYAVACGLAMHDIVS